MSGSINNSYSSSIRNPIKTIYIGESSTSGGGDTNWTLSGNNIYNNNTDISYNLDVSGSVRIRGDLIVDGSTNVAIGYNSGRFNQDISAVAIGFESGYTGQGSNSVAIGFESGYTDQGSSSIAIGNQAGKNSQGMSSIAIGDGAGFLGLNTSSPTHQLDINSNTFRLRTARTAGEICWDANYMYVCVATNTWKRIALSTW